MPACVRREVERVIAIGDLHGNYHGLLDILAYLDVIDAQGHWRGGSTHLVQLGDVLGRGGEPGKIFALLHRLETEAREQGGDVHVLLGNHEVLTLSGTLVYNTPAEFQDVADWAPVAFGALPDRESEIQEVLRISEDPVPREKYHRRLAMLGCETFQRYLDPSGPLGMWLIEQPSALILGDSLFVHGGLNRRHGLTDLEELNRSIRKEISAMAKGRQESVHLVKDGPQWNREFTLSRSDFSRPEIQSVLDYHGCRRMVVGHTPTGSIAPLRTGEILPLYEEKLWCVDTGIGEAYGRHLSAVVIGDGRVTAVYP